MGALEGFKLINIMLEIQIMIYLITGDQVHLEKKIPHQNTKGIFHLHLLVAVKVNKGPLKRAFIDNIFKWEFGDIYSRFSRSGQLGGRTLVL